MRKTLILAVVLCGMAMPQVGPPNCPPGSIDGPEVICARLLPDKWNRFVTAGNAYAQTLAGGVKDLRLKRAMLKAWDEVNACECF